VAAVVDHDGAHGAGLDHPVVPNVDEDVVPDGYNLKYRLEFLKLSLILLLSVAFSMLSESFN
jgi:hypothetical protein